jgi:hypothetical protein
LQIVAGLRSDRTTVGHSAYGTVSSLSPRLNAKYIFPDNPDAFVEKLSIHAGWGKTVKLPSFAALYPQPSYRDILTFASQSSANGDAYYAYYILPHTPQYNPNLRWQSARQMEIGLETRIKGVYVSLSAYLGKIVDPYLQTGEYTPFSYNLTAQEALNQCLIPESNRRYLVDKTSGIVTVTDKTGQYAPQVLDYKTRQTFKSVHSYVNGSPSVRKGIEWVVDFGKIQFLQTSVRLDGSYYDYRGTEETIEQGMPASAQYMADGNHYKYVGFYAGGNASANGSESQRLNANLMFTTHIPAVRLIVSLRLESSLYQYNRNLSEYKGEQRGFAMDDRGDYFPSGTQQNIYAGNRFSGLYPLYYVSYDDMQTKIPFADKLKEAKANDPALYNELVKMVVKTNTDYYFNPNKLSAYYFANISITKEIGDFVSISFNATNFLNNMQLVHSGWSDTKSTLFRSSYIPNFYYGLSLRLRFNK